MRQKCTSKVAPHVAMSSNKTMPKMLVSCRHCWRGPSPSPSSSSSPSSSASPSSRVASLMNCTMVSTAGRLR
uniref:Uncharacterized protein n=1 Tax=Macrostomum lignano TaxID=282301 RepID=A0A1I8GKW8_9PLAT